MTPDDDAKDTHTPAQNLADAIDREREGEGGVQPEPATIDEAVSNPDPTATS